MEIETYLGNDLMVSIFSKGDFESTGPLVDEANMLMEVSMQIMGQRIKVHMLKMNDRAWTRLSNQPWTEMPPEQVGMSGFDPISIFSMDNFAKEIERLGDLLIDEINNSGFRYRIDIDLIDQDKADQLAIDMGVSKDQFLEMMETATFEIWAGKEDFFIRRSTINMQFEAPIDESGQNIGKFRMVIKIDLGNFNQPIDIEVPAGIADEV